MNLDDLARFKEIDRQDMLAQIQDLPDQLLRAWQLGQDLPLPVPPAGGLQSVVIAGMGGSAIGADLLAAWCEPQVRIPVVVHRDYGLPAFASGAGILVIASSHSGHTEEALDAFETAARRGCTLLAVSTGGALAERASKHGVPAWRFVHHGQPRSAVGFSFGLLLALLVRLGLVQDPLNDLEEAVETMHKVQEKNGPAVPAALNPAKRYAGQLMGRWVSVFGSGMMAPVARRLKTQLNEIAKAGANFEFIPEADHNTLAGTQHPAEVLMPHTMNLFLRSPCDHPRNRKRMDLTKKAFMLEGLNTDFLDARGRSALANMWSQILFGDYMAYYLAMAYGVDPTPVEALTGFKESLKPQG